METAFTGYESHCFFRSFFRQYSQIVRVDKRVFEIMFNFNDPEHTNIVQDLLEKISKNFFPDKCDINQETRQDNNRYIIITFKSEADANMFVLAYGEYIYTKENTHYG